MTRNWAVSLILIAALIIVAASFYAGQKLERNAAVDAGAASYSVTQYGSTVYTYHGTGNANPNARPALASR